MNWKQWICLAAGLYFLFLLIMIPINHALVMGITNGMIAMGIGIVIGMVIVWAIMKWRNPFNDSKILSEYSSTMINIILVIAVFVVINIAIHLILM